MTTVVPAAVTPPGTATGRRPGGGREPPPTVSTLRQLARPACYYLASRALVLSATFVTATVTPALHLRTLGTIFDGRWYLAIAQHGYPHHLYQEGDGSRWAFFPAFPLVVRSVAVVTGLNLVDAALVAAFVFGLTSALAIWLAVRELCGTRLANGAVLLYVCCPTAYVLSLAYTEGLFLTSAALCLVALSRRAWVGAGLCACVAGLTRNAGAVVVLAVLVTALPAAWRGPRLRPLVGAALAPLGLASFMAYGWWAAGTPLASLSAERFWQGQHFVWFTTPVVAALAAFGQGPFGTTFLPDAFAAAALLFGFVGLWWLDRMGREPGVLLEPGRTSVPASWWLYTVGALLVAYSAYFTDSIPRYTMAAFPLFAALAWRVRDRALWVVAAGMAVVQVALLVDVLSAVHPVVDPLVP